MRARGCALLLLALPALGASVAFRTRLCRVARAAVVARSASMRVADEVEPSDAEPCNVVLTHTNADFDSLAGSVALAKLWNDEEKDTPTVVVMPRGANPALKRFLAYHKHLYPIRGFATIRPTDVRKIGVVDTQSRERIGRAADWLPFASSVAVYDHHNADPASAQEGGGARAAAGEIGGGSGSGADGGAPLGDIATSNANVETIIEATGSATTLLIERLRARGVQLRDAEATLFALGIRADTGCLTYEHTTVRDAKALVWLMEQGASQQAIAEFGVARMSPHQRTVLTSALQVRACCARGRQGRADRAPGGRAWRVRAGGGVPAGQERVSPRQPRRW
jgi:tRNA nucleotidyltransferase (CCA-adding enzyme)